MKRLALCAAVAVLLLPDFATAYPSLCPGDTRDLQCWDLYYQCIPECEGKNGDYISCRDQYCAEQRDNCMYGFVLSEETTFPIVSKTPIECASVCTTWTCYCTISTTSDMRVYDTQYNEVTTRRRRCCEDITGDWCPSGFEYDDVTIIPHDRECFKHDGACNWHNAGRITCVHHGCYINDDDTIRFTIYE